MQTRNILAIIITSLTAIVAVFAWPASNIEILGQEIDWNGLNLATITGDKYEGELQFQKSLDLEGGTKYTYITDLSIGDILSEDVLGEESSRAEESNEEPQELDYKELAQSNAEKFERRLEHYGYQDYELRWYLEGESTMKLELTISEQFEEDTQILQLLASKGEVQLWSQDPEYDPEAQEADELTQNFSFYTGMTQVEIPDDQILAIDSIYNQKAGGYGFKLTFSNDALLPILIATQSETYRGTMLVIDGQPIATRAYQLENIDKEDTEPVMYMSSLVGDNFAVNDAVEAVNRTGTLDNQFNLQLVEDVKPTLGENYLDNIKLAMILMFGFLSIVLIYRYNWLGIYQVLYLLVNVIWGLVFMKLFGTKLSLGLVAGISIGVLFILLMNLTLIRRLDTTEKIKILLEKIREVREMYRNIYLFVLVLIFVGGFAGLFVVDQLLGAFGVLIFIGIVELYIFSELFLPQFVYMQNKSWEKSKNKN